MCIYEVRKSKLWLMAVWTIYDFISSSWTKCVWDRNMEEEMQNGKEEKKKVEREKRKEKNKLIQLL